MDDDAIGSETEESGADWGNIHDPLQPEARDIISQKVKQLKRNERRKAAQRIAEARFLKRKTGKNVVNNSQSAQILVPPLELCEECWSRS